MGLYFMKKCNRIAINMHINFKIIDKMVQKQIEYQPVFEMLIIDNKLPV